MKLDDIVYDRRVKRFRYTEGTFVSQPVVKYKLEKFLAQKQRELVDYSQQLFRDTGNVTLQRHIAQTLKEIHIAGGALGAGGPDKLYANDYLAIARNLKNQYGLTDNNPKEYGLKFLYRDIETGYTGEKRLTERLIMYSKSYKHSLYTIEREKKFQDGNIFARRVLGFGENCKDCINYSGFGWLGINDIILPTQKCTCYTNCNCTLQYKKTLDITD